MKKIQMAQKEQPDKDSAVRGTQKPIQLRDIENRSSSNRKTSLSHESDEKIKKLLNKKKQYYKQPWNKLDNGMKINRLKHFCESQKEKNSLSDKEFETLKKLLITSCTSGKLNKSSDIVYNKRRRFY